ncbi:hypothetical protein ACJMK2_041646 [Sinanodonta woodiana]|uniref:Uncharacterized protein n=1 Tax=Sinanodonta woodiana TaxID=1069815 RepID=A0ABD3W5T1_SINWO
MSENIDMNAKQALQDYRNLDCCFCKDCLRDPLLLPCLHSICRKCLVQMLDSNKSRDIINCPTCDEDISIPENGEDGFEKNYFTDGLLLIYTAKTAKDIRCKICELQKKDTFAVYTCLDCGDFLCGDCSKAHCMTRMTIEHKVEPLEEVATGSHDKTIRAKRVIPCKEHKSEIIKYFCETCLVPICRECQLQYHVGHSCIPVAEAHTIRRSGIATNAQNLGQKLGGLKKVENSVNVTLEDIGKREKDLAEGVHKTAKKLTDQIEKEKAEILESLGRSMDEQRKLCNQKKKEIQRVYSIIEDNVKFCNALVGNGKDEEILYLEPIIRKRLKALQSKKTGESPMKWKPPDIRFRNIFLNIDRIGLFELTFAKDFARHIEAPIKFGSRHVAALHLVKRVSMTAKEDEFEARATGLACLPGDYIVVGDYENRKIKIFTKQGAFVETIANCKPISLASCHDTLASSDQLSLNLISFDKSFKRKISLESTGSSYPLASMMDQYFIVANNRNISFQIYDIHGDLVQEIIPVKGSKVKNPVFVTGNSKGYIIVSDWLTNTVIILDQSGKTIKDFKLKGTTPKAWLPGSLCVDQFDNIFVSDYSRSRIIVLNPQGEYMFEYQTRRDDLDRPKCMACDGMGHLFVSGKGGLLNVYVCEYA